MKLGSQSILTRVGLAFCVALNSWPASASLSAITLMSKPPIMASPSVFETEALSATVVNMWKTFHTQVTYPIWHASPRSWQPPTNLRAHDIANGQAFLEAQFKNGDLDQPVAWNRDRISTLLSLIPTPLKPNALVLEYGTGPGGFAYQFYKFARAHQWHPRLIMVDVFKPWFLIAHQLINQKLPGMKKEFHLLRDGDQKTLSIEKIRGNRKMDLIIVPSTFHVIPEKELDQTVRELRGALAPSGVVIWDSGDIVPRFGLPVHEVLLHEPFRSMRRAALARIKDENNPDYKQDRDYLAGLPRHKRDALAKEANQFFIEKPYTDQRLRQAFDHAQMEGEISHQRIEISEEDSQSFLRIQQLMDFLPEVKDLARRRLLIERVMAEEVLPSLPRSSDGKGYVVYWTFGIFRIIKNVPPIGKASRQKTPVTFPTPAYPAAKSAYAAKDPFPSLVISDPLKNYRFGRWPSLREFQLRSVVSPLFNPDFWVDLAFNSIVVLGYGVVTVFAIFLLATAMAVGGIQALRIGDPSKSEPAHSVLSRKFEVAA